jgi:hypothetical protein
MIKLLTHYSTVSRLPFVLIPLPTIARTVRFEVDELLASCIPDESEEGSKAGLRTMKTREWELNLTTVQVDSEHIGPAVEHHAAGCL